ncbi:LysR family transcriptional regulator [Corallococcus sp. BB11-1]|uniref:LysR family transcriptional regulator n=1 Tax=Corallococcus sp. BB11-1 TaxID=2996783 RepID=UPI00226D9FFF|nr:LysR family transcriptional regulator [Corallococcus sp. BB11-1]MCY1033449.1 LysR family transcriptional regulator [Corallococcus sp. BB11-1]
MPQWSDLQHFLAITRSGSLSAAARQLKVDQTTVGRRLAVLERELGARLFDRTPSGFRPTAVALRILPAAEAVEAEALRVERLASGEDLRPSGPVTVTATDTFLVHNVLPWLAGFRERHPEIELHLLSGYETLSLVRREADVAIRLVRPQESSLRARKVAAIGVVPFASQAYLDRRGAVRFDAGLQGHTVVGYAQDSRRWPESKWLDVHAARATVAVRLTSILGLLQAAREGLGVALLPAFFGHLHPELVPLRDALPELERTVWLVFHEDLANNARVRAVVDFLAETIGAQAASLAKAPARPRSASRGAARRVGKPRGNK